MTIALGSVWVVFAFGVLWVRRPHRLVASRRSTGDSAAAPSLRARREGRTRRPSRRRAAIVAARDLDDLAELVDLVRVAVTSGLPPVAALVMASEHVRARPGLALDALLVDLERGRSVGEAVSAWGARPPLDELAALLRSADRGGLAIGEALGALAVDLRRRRRRSAELRARRLPVTMLLPLVTCILPAFGLLTVVPMVAVGLGRISGMT